MLKTAYDFRNPLLTAAEVLLGVLEAGREAGIDLTDSLRACDIPPGLISSPKGYLPYHQVVNFLNDVAGRFDCPEFGFLAGTHQPPMRFGPSGQLPKHCANIKQGIELAIRYNLLNSEVSLWELECEEGHASLRRRERVSYSGSSVQIHTLAVTSVFKGLPLLGGSDWRTTSISFTHSQTKSRKSMERFFECPVNYDCDFNGITFPEECLKIPIASADESLLAVAMSYFDSIKKNYPPDDDLASKILHHIKQSLGTTRCNLVGVAQLLGQNPRTLQRELQKHGVTFRSLLSEVRQDLAQHYLRSSNIALIELADLLGYRNVSAFSRAFKNHCGQAPDHWRIEQAS